MNQEKTLQDLAGSIVVNQIALHYNEQIRHTSHYKHNLKKYLNLANKELIRAEEKEFDLIYDKDDTVTHQISSNLITYIDELVKDGFGDMMLKANIDMAYRKNPKALEGIVNKILNS